VPGRRRSQDARLQAQLSELHSDRRERAGAQLPRTIAPFEYDAILWGIMGIGYHSNGKKVDGGTRLSSGTFAGLNKADRAVKNAGGRQSDAQQPLV